MEQLETKKWFKNQVETRVQLDFEKFVRLVESEIFTAS
jgi:hypothetical protein